VETLNGGEWFLPPPAVTGGRKAAGIQHLNAGRLVRVARLFLSGEDGSAAPRSLIAKYLDEADSPGRDCLRERIYFQEELLNYHFLEGVRDRFQHAPRLLGEGVACFYLEDLGQSKQRLPTAEAIMEVLSEALVSLHAATQGEQDSYTTLRAALGHPPTAADLRSLHPGSDESSFRTGSRVLLDWSSVLLPGGADTIGEMLEHSLLLLQEEQDEHAFVHNDLVSARQCVLRQGRLFLVDFEHARYAHRALDLAKVMMGKLEITPSGKLVHVHPSLPTAIADVYRARWEARQSRKAGGAAWRAQIAAALCLQAVAEIGQCVSRSDASFLLGLAPTIASFLHRLDFHLKAIDGESPFRTALAQLLLRMPMLPSPAPLP
jgi:hypothetical protein